MKLLLFISFLTYSIFFFSQETKKNGVSILINPLNSVLSKDLNGRYDYITNENISIRHKNEISPELGVSYLKKMRNQYIGVGLRYKRFSYGYLFLANTEPFENAVHPHFILKDREFDIYLLGLNFFYEKSITKNTSVSISVTYNRILKYTDNLENDTNYSLTNRSKSIVENGELKDVWNTRLEIKESILSINSNFYTYLIPEINFKTKIYHNLFVNYGLKFKLWSINDLYYVNVNGYYTLDKQNSKLFSSHIDSRQIYSYFGISYTFGW